jgi:hypothetical protein
MLHSIKLILITVLLVLINICLCEDILRQNGAVLNVGTWFYWSDLAGNFFNANYRDLIGSYGGTRLALCTDANTCAMGGAAQYGTNYYIVAENDLCVSNHIGAPSSIVGFGVSCSRNYGAQFAIFKFKDLVCLKYSDSYISGRNQINPIGTKYTTTKRPTCLPFLIH